MALSFPVHGPEGERADFSPVPEQLTYHLQTLPSPGKHDGVASNVGDEGEGNGGFVCGTSER